MENRPRNLFNPNHRPPIQASAHSSRNYQPPSSQCNAKSYNTWPALPQRESTHAPGLEARAAASSSPGLAAGGRLDQAPQLQLQRRQDPLADPGKSPVEQASQNPSLSTPPHSPALVQQTCAQYFQTPEFTQALTQLVLKFSAYRYFRQGIAPKTISRILSNISSLLHPVTIMWVPGHECIPGNERVYAHVRGLSMRTLEARSPKPVRKPQEGIRTYHEITSTCGAPRADLFHCLWNCPKPMAVDPNPSLSSWEAALRVIGSDDQLWLVHRACLEMSARGLLDV
ncbi:hypothetical protein HPB51_013748 [Rhipicephalus microplus]|uniref:Tick transposon n=1 Tax=Rhipicephalus microplus TaxID=6941 RepID=A0A9J6F4S8_RHIMP|nr:hypothetical protein HPB51_013748 [Rhipicephalus microplus]